MKSLLTLLTLAAVATAPLATAQTLSSNPMPSLSSDPLERHAGIITPRPGYRTALEFDEQVLELCTGHSASFGFEACVLEQNQPAQPQEARS